MTRATLQCILGVWKLSSSDKTGAFHPCRVSACQLAISVDGSPNHVFHVLTKAMSRCGQSLRILCKAPQNQNVRYLAIFHRIKLLSSLARGCSVEPRAYGTGSGQSCESKVYETFPRLEGNQISFVLALGVRSRYHWEGRRIRAMEPRKQTDDPIWNFFSHL